MIPFEEALSLIAAHAKPLESEAVSLDRALGRVLAQDLVAPFAVPLFDNSSVDGYAVRSGDTADGAKLPLLGGVKAGDEPPRLTGVGTYRIFTGAPMPSGADAVAMQEDVERLDAHIVLREPIPHGQNVRYAGEELKVGDLALPSGTTLSPPAVALAASLGFAALEVGKLPRVSVVTTGSELVKPGTALRAAQIFESNSYGVAAALRSMGIEPVSVQNVADETEDVREALARALAQSDVVVTCGGISVGDYDLVRQSLLGLGVREIFWKVRVKPGKPCFLGTFGESGLAFGLSGNPVPALLMFEIFVKPPLRTMAGTSGGLTIQKARLASRLTKTDDRHELVRASLHSADDGTLLARPNEARGSHMLSGLAQSDAVIHFPAASSCIAAGETVAVTPVRWGQW